MFEEDGISVLNGRYGPYITDGKRNAKVPKGDDPAAITLEVAKKLLDEAPVRKRGASKKKKKKKATARSAES